MMTNEQLKLFEQNKGLAYKAAMSMVATGYVPKSLTDDAAQEALIGLMRAVKAYDAGRGLAFSTLAMCCCKRQVIRMMEAERKQTRAESGSSLDDVCGESGTTFAEFLLSDDDTEEEAVDWLGDAVYQVIGPEHEIWAWTLMESANGRTAGEIAQERGVSRQAVCKQIQRAREKLQEAMANAQL